MTSKNEIKTLGELSVDNKGSYGIAASAVEYSEDLYTYLRISDITDDGRINKNDLKSVNERNAEDYLLKPNDIVFARTGGSTGRNYFYDGNDGQFVYAGFLIKFSIDPQKVNPKYIKYYCQSKNYRDWVHSFNTGSTRGNINAQTYSKMPILLPPRTQQNVLVKVLSSLDDKIELNNKINQNLEQQADLLFNDLFLEDKDCIKLSEVISTTSGGTPSRKNLNFYTNGSFCWVKSKELNGTFITETEEKINQLAIEKSSAKLLPPYSVLLAMYGDTVGEYAIISKEMTCNQAICAIIPNEKYPYTYIYEYIKLSKEKIKTLAIGSAQQNISQVLIKDLPVHKNINKIKEYHFKTRNLFELIKNNQIENEKLKQLRDTLLPKLMSGEIDVDRVEV